MYYSLWMWLTMVFLFGEACVIASLSIEEPDITWYNCIGFITTWILIIIGVCSVVYCVIDEEEEHKNKKANTGSDQDNEVQEDQAPKQD